jgi:hypothetical protein
VLDTLGREGNSDTVLDWKMCRGYLNLKADRRGNPAAGYSFIFISVAEPVSFDFFDRIRIL